MKQKVCFSSEIQFRFYLVSFANSPFVSNEGKFAFAKVIAIFKVFATHFMFFKHTQTLGSSDDALQISLRVVHRTHKTPLLRSDE